MANDPTELREHLFGTIKGLKEKTISIEQAKAICEVSQSLINLAKVEVEYVKVTGADISGGFLDHVIKNIPGHTVHRIK